MIYEAGSMNPKTKVLVVEDVKKAIRKVDAGERVLMLLEKELGLIN